MANLDYTDIGSKRKTIVIFFTVLLTIFLIGALGYHFLEDWSFFDSIYMVLISITTVGYGEIHHLSKAGRLLTIFIIIGGVAVLGYGLSVIMSFVVEGELTNLIKRRKMNKEIVKLKNHFIVCGSGDTGINIIEEFAKSKKPTVVIEQTDERIDLIKNKENVFYIKGDATNDNVLLEANIKNAEGLVTTLHTDKDNLFVVLTARELNKDLKIISRAIINSTERKLYSAGASFVVSPNFIGGMRMASIMLRPAVVNFLDQMLRRDDATLRFEEVTIKKGSGICDKALMECQIPQRTGLIVVAMRKGGAEKYQFNPVSKTKLDGEDVLIVMGSIEQVMKLRSLAGN